MSPSSGLLVVVALIHLLVPARGEAQDTNPRGITDSMVSAGFENIGVAFQADGSLEIRYENRIERWELAALGRVAGRVIPFLGTEGNLALTPLTRGVATRTLTAPIDAWRRFLAGEMETAAFQEVLTLSESGPWPAIGSAGESAGHLLNPSYRRIDLALRPLMTQFL